MLTWLANSAIVTLGATFISLIDRDARRLQPVALQNRAQQGAGFALLVSKMLPPEPDRDSVLHRLFDLRPDRQPLGPRSSANAAVGVPFATWLMKGFFDGIPREIELAAMLDGCRTARRRYGTSCCRWLRQGWRRARIYLAIVTWSDFVFARTLRHQPRPLGADGRHAIVPRRISGRLVEPDGGGRAVARAGVRAVSSARAVPGERR